MTIWTEQNDEENYLTSDPRRVSFGKTEDWDTSKSRSEEFREELPNKDGRKDDPKESESFLVSEGVLHRHGHDLISIMNHFEINRMNGWPCLDEGRRINWPWGVAKGKRCKFCSSYVDLSMPESTEWFRWEEPTGKHRTISLVQRFHIQTIDFQAKWRWQFQRWAPSYNLVNREATSISIRLDSRGRRFERNDDWHKSSAAKTEIAVAADPAVLAIIPIATCSLRQERSQHEIQRRVILAHLILKSPGLRIAQSLPFDALGKMRYHLILCSFVLSAKSRSTEKTKATYAFPAM